MAKIKQPVTTKLRRLVKRTMREAERDDYRFSKEFKEQVEQADWRKLKELRKDRYRKLYEQATAEYEGDIISGTEERTRRRSEAARKGAETKRRKREERDREQAEQDAINKTFPVGIDIYNNLKDIIDTNIPLPGAEILQQLITKEIRDFGYEKFIASLYFSQNTDIAEQATKLADSGSDDIRRGLHIPPYNALIKIITQCKLSFDLLVKISLAGEKTEDGEVEFWGGN